MDNKKIETILDYIEDVMDESDEKVLTIIREALKDASPIFHSPMRRRSLPKVFFGFPSLDCEQGKFNIWRRRIRLLADKMSNFNLKKNP